MKKNIKRNIILIFVFILITTFLVWGGSLVKNLVLTEKHKDKIENIQFIENENPLPKFDWYRVISYSDEMIEIYFVNTLGKGSDSEYKIGGKIICYETSNGWYHTSISESILWSGAGSADSYIWPYWYHIFLT